MKLAIIGSRSFNSFAKALEVFNQNFPNGDISEVVSGGAKGADTVGKAIAERLGLKYTEFLPDWEKDGFGAGFKRNHLIIDNSDIVLAFWDGESRGTAHSIGLANAQKKKVIIHTFKPEETSWHDFGLD